MQGVKGGLLGPLRSERETRRDDKERGTQEHGTCGCMRGEGIRETCIETERAVEHNDSGRMYCGLRQLGARLQGKNMMNDLSIKTTAAKEHRLAQQPSMEIPCEQGNEGLILHIICDLCGALEIRIEMEAC